MSLGKQVTERPPAAPADQCSASALAVDLPRIRLGDLQVHAIREAECVAHVMRQLACGRGGWIATVNLDHMWRLRRCPEFAAAYRETTVIVADGMPLVWASRLQGTPLPERVAGSDLIFSLSKAAGEHGRRVFLLGGNPGTAAAAAERLRAAYPNLTVAGTCCPELGFEKDPARMQQLREQLVQAAPDIVYVALGAPKQELFIRSMRAALPGAWWIGVGISFSFVAGEIRRAPRWLQRIGLEWVHRLRQEPRRLWNRYLWHGPPFAARLFGQALWRRLRS
jgi:N-acetylglucosaminyldiphosphoundecaprenol N-acetyl-beta-D-mannosaminyltransferase